MPKTHLDEAAVDDLARMLTALLSEVWIIRDRMAVLERVLADRVGLQPRELDEYAPDPELSAELERLRDRLIGAVVTAPIAGRDNAVASILARAGLEQPGGQSALAEDYWTS